MFTVLDYAVLLCFVFSAAVRRHMCCVYDVCFYYFAVAWSVGGP